MNKKSEIKKVCYVCGLNLYDYPYDPESFTPNPEMICPCCGTHYGLEDEGGGKVEIPDDLVDSYHDFGDDAHKKIIKILRQNWIDEGMKWLIPETISSPMPQNWDPKKQLENVPEEFK